MCVQFSGPIDQPDYRFLPKHPNLNYKRQTDDRLPLRRDRNKSLFGYLVFASCSHCNSKQRLIEHPKLKEKVYGLDLLEIHLDSLLHDISHLTEEVCVSVHSIDAALKVSFVGLKILHRLHRR